MMVNIALAKIERFDPPDANTPEEKTAARVARQMDQIEQLEGRIPAFIGEMSLVYLVAQFEEFLKGRVEGHPYSRVSTSRPSGSQPFRELRYQNPKSIDKYLRTRFGISLSDRTDWIIFSEYFARRNLLVHNDGLVDESYRGRTGYSGPGGYIGMDANYLEQAVRVFPTYARLIDKLFEREVARRI